MNQDISQLITETQRLREANKDLETSLLKLQQAFDKITQGVSKSSKAYQDGLSVLNKIENGLKNTNEQLEKQSRALEQVSNSAAKSSADLSTLAAQQDNLKKAQQSHGDEVLKLQVSFKALGETIDEQSGKAKEQADGFDYFGKTFEAIDSSLKDLKDSAGAFAPQLESVMSGFNALKTGLDVAKDGFSGVGAALKATGFGLLMLVLQSITEYFSTDKIGIRKFQSILAGLSVVIEKIKNAFSSLGKSIVDAVLHPGDTAKKLWNGFVENIGNRFKAFGVILNGVMDLNPKKIADGVLQLSTGVTNATDKIKAAYKTVKDEAVNTWTAVEAAARKTYKQLSVDAGNNQSGNPKKIKHKAGKRAEKITREPQLEQVIHKSVSRIDAEKKAFDEELTLLEDQLNKKLITQEEYYKKAAELNKKYKQGILTALQDTTPAAMSEHFKDESEKARLKAAIANDEKNTKSVLPWKKNQAEKKLIEDKYAYEILQAKGNADKIKELESQKLADLNELNKRYEQQKKEFALNTAQQVADKAFSIIGNNIKAGSDAKIKSLEKDKAAELSNKNLTQSQRKAIEDKYQKKENQEKVKAFKAEQKVQIAQAVINGAVGVQKTIAEWGMPFAIPFMIPVVAQTATQIATIASQKPPAYAKGGQFVSDGRGALLPGYSRTDNTNAYLRSGEAVVVSEAMRNPWARNLVSAINVAHGGRDFSVPNSTRGYAIGGIFTDGGNANRYYNQPVNDIKDMANTLAYQMINNFPPIYVDVKDVNNQQSILAQTVNRVNL